MMTVRVVVDSLIGYGPKRSIYYPDVTCSYGTLFLRDMLNPCMVPFVGLLD